MKLTFRNTGFSFFDKKGNDYHVIYAAGKRGYRTCFVLKNRKEIYHIPNQKYITPTTAKKILEKVLRELSLWE